MAGEVRLHIAPLLACARALAKTLNGEPTEVAYPPLPIIAKLPACPINTCLPAMDTGGKWQFEGDAPNIEGRFIDAAGNTLRRRAELIKHIK